MKKFLFSVAALVMIPASAYAQDACSKIGELAGTIMKARQANIPKDTVVAAISPGSAYKISMSLVELAYYTPVYPNEYQKNLSIENFNMQAKYVCYSNFNT